MCATVGKNGGGGKVEPNEPPTDLGTCSPGKLWRAHDVRPNECIVLNRQRKWDIDLDVGSVVSKSLTSIDSAKLTTEAIRADGLVGSSCVISGGNVLPLLSRP